MDLPTLLLIALGLAMDAFAVSIGSGVTIKDRRVHHAFKFGLFFGSFQAVMPVLGWLAGMNLRDLVAHVDHWVAFGLLLLIGGKMIYESIKTGGDARENVSFSLSVLLVLSVATSIDAFAVGLSFAFLKIAIAAPVMIIGGVTFFLSFIGVLLGSRMGHLFEKRMELFGGLILIAIGLKILFEHTL